jgi:hypothetical protein
MRLELVQDAGNAVLSRLDVRVTVMDDLAETVGTNALDGVVLEELIASSDESSGTAVGEKFLLQRGSRDNGDGRGTG